MDSVDVRLARIEQGIQHTHNRMEERHFELKECIKPLSDKVNDHHVELKIIHRDRKWIYAILVTMTGALGFVLKIVLHSQ